MGESHKLVSRILPKALIGDHIQTARFVIGQNGKDDGLQISTHALAVVIELLRHAVNIPRTGIAGDQPLRSVAAR